MKIDNFEPKKLKSVNKNISSKVQLLEDKLSFFAKLKRFLFGSKRG